MDVERGDFVWDADKEYENIWKHGVDFTEAAKVFMDAHRVIIRDIGHSAQEERYHCFGRVEDGVLTVRFTYRGDKIRMIGAGYWRKGRDVYEEKNRIY
jgi:uncharacterized protein